MNQISNSILVSPPEGISLELPSDHSCSFKLETIELILSQLDPNIHYNDWLRVGAAIFNETQGSLLGFALFDEWRCKSNKYKGEAETYKKWKSYKPNHPNPAKLGTLIHILKCHGVSWEECNPAHKAPSIKAGRRRQK